MSRLTKIKRTRLSSVLTFPYKYLIPLILLGLLFVLNCLIASKVTEIDVVVINVAYLITMTVGYLPLANIKKVYYDKTSLYVSNFIVEREYKLESITKVKRRFVFHYRIFIAENGTTIKIKFMPYERMSIFTLFRKPDSIVKFERNLARVKYEDKKKHPIVCVD